MSRWAVLSLLVACGTPERPAPGAAPSAARLDPTLRATIWSTGYGQSFDAYTAGDFNGDGYADLAVGSAQASLYTGLGAVWVHPGGPGGVGESPSLVLSGAEVYDFLGASLAAGDFDGDGYADLAAGASGRDGTGGAVAVYRGGASGLPSSASATLAAPLYGSFGAALAAAGDVDGDGYEDLVVTDAFDSTSGALHLFRGGAAGLGATPASTSLGAAGGYFGYAVAGLGDVNGDGYADVGVSDPYADGYDGEIQVFLGGPAGLGAAADLVLDYPGSVSWAFFGTRFGAAGDVNDDGYADLVAGAEYEGASGVAYVWLGGPGGFAASPDQALAPGGSAFGADVAGVGDMDGDGVDDVVVGDRWAAEASLFLGGPGGLATTADSSVTTAWPGWSEAFGARLLGPGDLDGDGSPDLVVGDSYLADWGSTVQGFAQVFHGERTVTVDADGDGWTNDWDCDDGDAAVLPWHCADPRDVVVDGVAVTYSGAVSARAVWVVNGGTLRVGAYDGGPNSGWLQLDADLVRVDTSSMIEGAGRGSPGGAPGSAGAGVGGGAGAGAGFGGGGGFGGAGGVGMASCSVATGAGGGSYGATDDFVIRRGSGGGGGAAVLGSSGRGGAGGAGVGIVAGELQLLGRVRVDGAAPGGGRAGERGGGGSGGSIVLDVGVLACDGGVLSARGGPGTLGAAGAGGSGGGGRIQVVAGSGSLAGCSVRVGPGPERCAGAGAAPGSVYTGG